MRCIIWFIWSLTCYKKCMGHFYKSYPLKYPSWYERYHYPGAYTGKPTPYVNGSWTRIPDPYYAPDFRLEEAHYTPAVYYALETDRPYRLSPHKKTLKYWLKQDNAWMLGCYCCTVFRRATLLGGCLVITTRHILTSATSTEIVLKSYKSMPHLTGLLGAWYDNDKDNYNTSIYFTPARIHHHPEYLRENEVNASHPIPCVYDLSVWAGTVSLQGFFFRSGAIICSRAVSSASQYMDPFPRSGDQYVVLGYQFMKAYGRRPAPWYKYGIRITKFDVPCAKTEWVWFICMRATYLKYGIDSGAGLHFQDRGRTWRLDGAVGVGAFSMHLRSKGLSHYYTVIDTYPVLDFFYDAMMGYLPYVYLDYRFANSQGRAPVIYSGEYVYSSYPDGAIYNYYEPPNYRK